jgi:uncharacterized protein
VVQELILINMEIEGGPKTCGINSARMLGNHMPDSSLSKAPDQDVSLGALFTFFLMSFGLAWGILGLYIFNGAQMTALFGAITGRHPLFVLAVYAPALAALYVVFGAGGIDGIKRYLTRLLLWRCSSTWFAFLIVGIPLIYGAGAWLKGNLLQNPFPCTDVGALLSSIGFMLILGPVEELGWRGVALPIIQRYLAPVWAGLLLGLIWGFWHLPAFLLSGTPQESWQFFPFFLGSVAVSLILTALFNAAKGSILMAVLFHFQLNNPLWPDAQPYDMYIFGFVALVVLFVNRATMFTKKGAVTQVIPALRSQASLPNNALGRQM